MKNPKPVVVVPPPLTKNWFTRIEEAKQIGYFTREDKALAASWVTCACGERTDIAFEPAGLSGERGRPIDNKLFELGVNFHFAVINHNISGAYSLLHQIESRAKELSENKLMSHNL